MSRVLFQLLITVICSLFAVSVATAAGRVLTPKQLEMVESARKSEKYAAHPEWALTVDEAVADLLSRLPSEKREAIKGMKSEELPGLHHSLGRHIRNRYGLWRGNVFLHVSCESVIDGEFDADRCSTVIIEALWLELNKGS